MPHLSSSAQKFQDFLRSQGPAYIVIEFNESTRTAQEAADRVGCQLGQIVKSLIFRGKTTNKGVLVLTSGTNRADESKISQVTGEPITRPDADFVRALTGFSIGGVPPVGHITSIETYIDEDLLQYPTVWASAGTPNAVFELSPSDLVNLSRGKAIPVKES